MIEAYEYYSHKENAASKQARQLLNRSSVPRAELEDIEQEISTDLTSPFVNNKNAKKEYLSCLKCTCHGIRTKYLKSTMLEVIRKTTRNGRPVIVRQHYCAECAKTYKPHSQRVGGKTY